MPLSKDQLAVLSELLDKGLDLPQASRGAWVEGLTEPFGGAKSILRKMLDQEASGEAEDFLDTLPKFPATGNTTAHGPQLGLQPGTRIGIYLLIREIGQGGMSSVWLARRTDELVKRPVALKLPHLHLQSARYAERFARERDILANLTHPHIAHLYDAGISAEGQPFLAMEFIAGEPLTQYCTAHQLGVDERLQVFLQVLNAVDYAHAQSVIHRDLKPSNILVRDDGQVALLDFGIAKFIVEGQAAETELTRRGGAALTPHYASPEQIKGETLGPATDVYSLGVLLYELLSGQRPYELAGSTRRSLEEAILSTEPPRPSEVVTRQTRPRQLGSAPELLRNRLKGDLDTIVLKALKKSASDRYPTAGAFAEDLHRYLRRDAVSAQPDTSWYRLKKLAHRHQSALQGAGVAALAVATVAVIGILNGSRFANRHVVADTIDPKSIAVLPFVDMSAGRDQQYFADGMTEEMIDLLSKIPRLKVIARTSTYYFKDRKNTVAEIGKILGVANVLEGSVRKSGNTLRITAQLVQANTGFHVWSETYDRPFDDIFKVQDTIAVEISEKLKGSLTNDPTPHSAVPKNTDAYVWYLRALSMRHGLRGQEEAAAIIEYLNKSIAADPDYAPAWAELSRALVYQVNGGFELPAAISVRAHGAAERALTLDPQLAAAHVAAGVVHEFIDWDFATAEQDYRRALNIAPNWPDALEFFGNLKESFGNLDEARVLYERSIALDPLDERYYLDLGDIEFLLGHTDKSESEFRTALKLNPKMPDSYWETSFCRLARGDTSGALTIANRNPQESSRLWNLAIVYFAMGRSKESNDALSELEKKYADDWAYQIAESYAYRGDADHAIAWLDRAYRQRDTSFEHLNIDWQLTSLRNDPRYHEFLKKIKLPERVD